MRTYFRKLNESSIFSLRDYDLYKITDIKGLLLDISDDMTKIDDVFFEKNGYKSKRLEDLKREGIILKEDDSYVDDNIFNTNSKWSSYIKYLYSNIKDNIEYSLNKYLDRDKLSRILGVDDNYFDDDVGFNNDSREQEFYYYLIDELVKYIISEHININCINYYNNEYALVNIYLLDNGGGNIISYVYDVRNEDNKFGIKDGDLVSKDDLIEYGKSLVGISSDKETLTLYTTYFDNI